MTEYEAGKEGRKYDALVNVPWSVRADIADRIERMPDGNQKTILYLYFISGMSSREIPLYCQKHGIRSRNNTFYTSRSVLNICNKYFPEVRQYVKHNPENEKRKKHFIYLSKTKRQPCAICGSTEQLHFHHMIPVDMGGTTSPENMVNLCSKCHYAVTSYQRRNGFIGGIEKKEEGA